MPSDITIYVQQSVHLADNALRLARKIEQQLYQLPNRELLWRF